MNIQNEVTDELAATYPEAGRMESLPDMLYRISQITGQKFIFIIDEWDALFREVKDDKFLLDSYIQFLRGIFKDSGKTDTMIEAAYMTGILPIKKYGSQSAVSDFREYTMLTGERVPIETETFQNDMTNIRRKDDVLTLLVHLGYLAYDADKKSVFIPNEEVRQEFVRVVTTGKYYSAV